MGRGARDPSEDRAEIRRLVFLYAERLDAGEIDDFARLFERGSLCLEDSAERLEGAAAVRERMETGMRFYAGRPRTQHVVPTVEVAVGADGETAEASSRFFVLQALVDFPLQVIVTGRYLDRLVRDSRGEWAFQDRRIFVDLAGDTSRHLVPVG
jgi:3-phenylpropionate/cinnamic acid dioxygenase small subunit